MPYNLKSLIRELTCKECGKHTMCMVIECIFVVISVKENIGGNVIYEK